MPIIRLADGRVERLVMDVKQAAPMQRTHRNRLGHPTGRESLEEVVRLLAVDDPGEGAVLPLDEDATVEHHRDQEARLSLGEAERGHRLGPVEGEGVDVPLARGNWQAHTNSSASPPNRRPPPFPRLA